MLMEKQWSQLTTDERMQRRFEVWLSPKDIEFVNEQAKILYQERVKRLIDVITLKEPDRVPVVLSPAHAPAKYCGYTTRDVMYDQDKLHSAWQKYINDLDHDVLPSDSLGPLWSSPGYPG